GGPGYGTPSGNQGLGGFGAGSSGIGYQDALVDVGGAGGGGAGLGGAIFNASHLRVRNCTFYGNAAFGGSSFGLPNYPITIGESGKGYGGAIFSMSNSILDVLHATLSGNVAANGGRGIYALSTDVWLSNVLIGQSDTNVTDYAGSGCSYSLATSNLVRTSVELPAGAITGDPLLMPLENYGGLTQTMPIRSGSAALGAGVYIGLNTDQRGVARPLPPSIGAFDPEVLAGAIGVPVSRQLAVPNNGGPYSGFTVTDGGPPAGTTISDSGLWSGTPVADGSFYISVGATGAAGFGRNLYILEIGPPVLTLSPDTLPGAQAGVAYTQDFSAAAGTAPYTYTAVSGTLPPGLMLSSSGRLGGVPTRSGLFDFTVQATDSSGGAGPYTTSKVYSLSINAHDVCVGVVPGIFSWWRGEGNADDAAAGRQGTVVGGVSYTVGMVDQAFDFNGTDGAVTLPQDLVASISNNFTVECWVRPAAGRSVIAETNSGFGGLSGQRYALFPESGGDTGAGVGLSVGTNGVCVVEHGSFYIPALLVYEAALTNWRHIAVVYEDKRPTLYLDGVQVRTGLRSPRETVCPMFSLGGAYGYYAGLLDEVTVYDRVLTSNEIAAISIAEMQGKCTGLLPPVILSSPAGQSLVPGQSATLEVSVTGTPPIACQWVQDGMPVEGASGTSLQLTDLRIGLQNYQAILSNAQGVVTTRTATLTVRDTQCISLPAGARSWWRGEDNAADTLTNQHGTAQGALGFAPGKVGQAFDFNGSNAWVDLPDGMYRDIADTFTLEFWALPAAARLTTPESNVGVGALTGQRFPLLPESGGLAACAGVSVGTNGISVVEHGNDYLPSLLVYDTPITDWAHIAVVYQDKQPSLYLNGRLVRTGLCSLRSAVYPSFDLTGSYGYYKGLLDEISIYDRALSGEEIAAIYVSDSLGKCGTQAVFYVAFDGVSSDHRLRMAGGNGLPYMVQSSTNLVTWQTVVTNPGSLGPVYYTPPFDVDDQTRSYFYRARKTIE
ncbi:MAG: hypothetical protein EOM20_17590, partial [Spartobacteria bacterium]|nr:hypothetical protein [Spartobacteria bacterium]